MERYYGTLMYCTFLPFSIHAPSEKEAIAEMQRLAPQVLSESEKRELSAHLTRIPQADRVMVIKKDTQNAKKSPDKRIAQKVA